MGCGVKNGTFRGFAMAPYRAGMSIFRRLSSLDAKVFGFRRSDETAEAFLRRFADGRGRDTRAACR